MKRSKVISIIILLAVCAVIARMFIVKKNENVNTITEESSPTPTSSQEPEPSGNFGKISYYNRAYCEQFNPNCHTASGEVFDDTAFTCACVDSYPLGTTFKVSYEGNSVVVRCNDRGDFKSKGRTLDMSEASFEALAPRSKGVIEAKIEVVYSEYDKFDQYREKQGLSKLTKNENLEKSANESAKDIYYGKRSWSHDGYQNYITKYYKGWHFIGENLARDYKSFDEALSAWNISDKHRELMQSNDFSEVGIGNCGEFWVMHLGGKYENYN